MPDVDPLGTDTTMLVGVQLVDVAGIPLKVTVLEPWEGPKFTPEIVTELPTAPATGDKLLIKGVCDTLNGTPLLTSPFAVITIFPDVAFIGTGTSMLVELQLVGDAAVPLNVKVLEPCAEPKFVPPIITEAPGAATLGDSQVIEGAELCAPKFTETLLKFAVERVDVPVLSATKPTYTFAAMLSV